MGFNFGAIRTRIRAVVEDLLGDEDLATSITYRKATGHSWDSVNRRNIQTYSDTTLSAIKTMHNRRSVQVSAAKVEEGDVAFIVDYEDMPTGISLNDTIIEGGETHRLKAIDDRFRIVYILTVHGSS